MYFFITRITLCLFAFSIHHYSIAQAKQDSWIKDKYGAVIRGDLAHKDVALVFAGDSIADDIKKIAEVLKRNSIQASFFLTGSFFAAPENKELINELIKDDHYLGPHADADKPYVASQNTDSTLLNFESFKHDLHENFKHLSKFGIKKDGAQFFLTPSELYNSTIVDWASQLDLYLISSSPGMLAHLTSRSNAAEQSSNEISTAVLSAEQKDKHGLNGVILVFDIASEKGHEQFYAQLERLVVELDHRGYSFVEINELLD